MCDEYYKKRHIKVVITCSRWKPHWKNEGYQVKHIKRLCKKRSLYYVQEVDRKLSGKHIKMVKREAATLAKPCMFEDL